MMGRWVAALLMLLGVRVSMAQELTLRVGEVVEGEVRAATPLRYSLDAPEGAVLSISVDALDISLDPRVRIYAADETLLIENDDWSFPTLAGRDAIIEAYTIPETGTYSIEVSGVAATSGRYQLAVWPGYADLVLAENFNAPNEFWVESESSANKQASFAAGGYRLEQSGISQQLISTRFFPSGRDQAVQVAVREIAGNNGWIVGQLVEWRLEQGGYSFQVNHQGAWRFVFQRGEETRIVRDWTTHPAIVAGETQFTLGVFAYPQQQAEGTRRQASAERWFDLFYNGVYVGTAQDAEFAGVGSYIGLMTQTSNSADSEVRAVFDDLLITQAIRPMETLGRLLPAMIPSGSSSYVARSLQRMGLLEAGGAMALTIDESSAQAGQVGVQRFGLARGTTFTTFALGVRISGTLESGTGLGGCGLLLRETDAAALLVYTDSQGGYGFAWRDALGFRENLFFEQAERPFSADLLVLGYPQRALLYVDGRYVGEIPLLSVDAGGLANAVLNYDAATTSCQYRNLWLWQVE